MAVQALTLLTIFRVFENKQPEKSVKPEMVIGLLAGILFLLKPNLIGILLAYTIFKLIYFDFRLAFRSFLVLICSFFVTIGLVFLYFFLNRAGVDLLDQVIRFNLIYSQSGTKDFSEIIIYFVKFLMPYTIFVFGLPFFIFGRFRKMWKKEYNFIIIWLVIEVFLCAISKREYKQYFLATLLPLSLYISLFCLAGEQIFNISKNKFIFSGIILVIILFFNRVEIINMVKKMDSEKPFNKALIFRGFLYNNFQEHQEFFDIIAKYTNESDRIVIWGSEPSLLFLSKRATIDRYFYQFRLFLPKYDLKQIRITEFVQDTKSSKPKIIIDAGKSTVDQDVSDFPQSPPLNEVEYKKWLSDTSNIESPAIEELILFIKNNYSKESQIYHGSWDVYVRK